MTSRGKSFDRFINPRVKTDVAHFNLSHKDINSLSDIEDYEENPYLTPTFLNTAKKANSRVLLRKKILDALSIHHSSVLRPFHLKKSNHAQRSWPVVPRTKPLIGAPTTVLDMPSVNSIDETHSYRHMIDWGKKGQIAAIFNGEVYIWCGPYDRGASTNTEKTVSHCVKWNRSGTMLAVSRVRCWISFIDGETLKILRTLSCQCLHCNVNTIEWLDDNYLVTACSSGRISIFSKTISEPYVLTVIPNEEIVALQFSCYNTYLLANTWNGHCFIFKWNMTNLEFVSKSYGDGFTIKSFAWHPWKESLLVLGSLFGLINICNMNTLKGEPSKTITPVFKVDSICFLDFLTFNPLSGELLVSFYHENPHSSNDSGCNFLTVFSDLNTKVDEIRYHVGRVPYAIWDGSGTKLATIGTDENLVIWNFFGDHLEPERIPWYKHSKPNPARKIFDLKNNFGSCIR